MAICLIVENPDETKEQFEQIVADVRSTGPFPPDGGRLMVAGPANPGWRVITVWDSEEAATGSSPIDSPRPSRRRECPSTA